MVLVGSLRVVVVVSTCSRGEGLLSSLRTVSFLTCQKGLETQVIDCQLFFLHSLILFLCLILCRCFLSLLRLVALRHRLALHLLQPSMPISLSLLRPLLLLLAALRRHHYLDLWRVPVLLLDYLVNLSAAHAGVSAGPPARCGQVHLPVLIRYICLPQVLCSTALRRVQIVIAPILQRTHLFRMRCQ